MLRYSKLADERREVGRLECWCLHGSVGSAADWRSLGAELATAGIGSRAVDLWRFLECEPMPPAVFAQALNAEALGEAPRGRHRVLLGYSLGGRLALHALLGQPHPWQAAIIISAHPGLEDGNERATRLAADAIWAARAFRDDWQLFLDDWNAQPLLAGAPIREPAASRNLSLRRREIARSFVDWSLGNQQPLWSALSAITIPTLWIAGEADTKYRALAERAATLVPGASLAIAPSAGHRVPWDAGPWLAAQIRDFLLASHHPATQPPAGSSKARL
jgi:2-succinyl-6-hydroxy-2,4-cyclohexadiene-1-carboxylate synthase